jgi:hypothetical protein
MANTAKITWVTAMAADWQVEHGTTPSYGSVTTRAASHSVAVSGLTGGTTYHFRVRSSDASGSLVVGPDYALTISIPITISLSPQSATIAANGTQQFTATVGNDSNHAVSWSATTRSVSCSRVIHCAQRLFKYTGHDHCDQPCGHHQDAVDSQGRESKYSNEFKVTVP